jgi:hypothetical protein
MEVSSGKKFPREINTLPARPPKSWRTPPVVESPVPSPPTLPAGSGRGSSCKVWPRATRRTPGWRPGKKNLFPDILRGWPRAFISGSGIVGPGALRTPSNPAHFPIPRKEREQGSARGKMAHSTCLGPPTPGLFLARGR